MKKCLAILLCLILALGCSAALAEQAEGKITLGTININGAFTLQCGLPEGYRIQPVKVSRDQIISLLTSDDPEKPVMQLSVAFDEAYSDVDRMNDLSDEELALLEATFTEVDPTIEITYGDTGLGTRLMIAMQRDEETLNYVDFFSIYKGYFVEFVMLPSQGASSRTLTQEQMATAVDFLTDLDFVPVQTDAGEEEQIEEGTYIANLSGYDPTTGTLQAELRAPITLEPAVVEALAVGDTLTVGAESFTVENVEKDEYGDIMITEELALREQNGKYHAYLYESEFLETLGTITLHVSDDLVFEDEIDPESGEILETTATRTAEEFIALLTVEGGIGFTSDTVRIIFDEAFRLNSVYRFYAPWQ